MFCEQGSIKHVSYTIHPVYNTLFLNDSENEEEERRGGWRGGKGLIILVVLVLDELDDDVLLGLDLEHLHDEAHEGGGLAVAAEGAAEVVELHGLVD